MHHPLSLVLLFFSGLSPLLAAVDNGVPKDVAALNAKTVWVNPPKKAISMA